MNVDKMKIYFKEVLENGNGFTLSEIMVVVVILGILASAALPKYGTVVERFSAKEGVTALMSVYSAEKRYKSDMGEYTSDSSLSSGDLDIVENGDTLPLKHFDQPVLLTNGVAGSDTDCSSSSVWIAKIRRNNGEYTLCVDEDGEIYCKGDICKKIKVSSHDPL